MQMVLRWAIGKEAFGIQPNGSLRTLIVQAENDDGDMAEMRDGIVAGLGFTEEEARVATAGVLVIQEDERTAAAFCGMLDHTLGEHDLDVVVIDPALAYLGGEASSQKDVTAFLRTELTPVLRRRDVGAIVVHHTNKPITGKDKSPWNAGDHAYAGSGSAEWANWPKGVINLRNVGSHDQFELQLGKRGKRIGWTEEDGVTNRYTARIAHAQSGQGIFWRRVTEQEEMLAGVEGSKASKTRNDLLPVCLIVAGHDFNHGWVKKL